MVRTRAGLVVLAVAAGILALGEVLVGAGTVIYSFANAATSRDLVTAGGWMFFSGTAVALLAVGVVGWGLVVAQRWALVREIVGAALGTLLLTIGALVTATSPRSTAGDILWALGFGVWAVLLVSVAARMSMAVREPSPSSPPVTTPWLVAAGALVLVAVASGLPAPTRSDHTGAIVGGCLAAVGTGVLAALLLSCRARGLLRSRAVLTAAVGLGGLAAHEIANAVYAAVSFSPTSTLTDFRVTATVASFLGAAAWLVLGLATWQQVEGAPPGHPFAPLTPAGQAGPPGPEDPTPPAAPAGSTAPAGQCPRCGAPTATDAHFCSRCGSPLGPPARP